jgi:methionine sulfoxide reductase heme-binding subunit
VLVGFTAFLLLLPLAITSTKGWQRRMGKRWKRLHQVVYLAAPLAVIHFVWLVKADIREPLL